MRLPYKGKSSQGLAFIGKTRILKQNIGKLVFYTNSPPNHYISRLHNMDYWIFHVMFALYINTKPL